MLANTCVKLRNSLESLKIFDANLKNFDPTVNQQGDSRVPGPFGGKKIVSDGGATRHMLHCRKRFVVEHERT